MMSKKANLKNNESAENSAEPFVEQKIEEKVEPIGKATTNSKDSKAKKTKQSNSKIEQKAKSEETVLIENDKNSSQSNNEKIENSEVQANQQNINGEKETTETNSPNTPIELLTNNTEKETVEEIGISKEIINEKMKEVYELKNPKKRKKSAILNIILLIINIILMAFILKTLFSSVDDANLFDIIANQKNKMWWLVGGFVMYGVFVFSQMLTYRLLVKNLSGRKSWKIAYDLAITGKYYDNVTPFAVGGQTMQILRLTEHGIGAGVSTSIPLLKMIINSGVNATLALLFFVFGIPFISTASSLNNLLILLLEIVGVIGLIITILITLFIFFISTGTIVTRSLVSWVLKIGYKLRLIKDFRTTYKKVMNQVAEYKFSMGYLWKHKKTLLLLILFNLLECLSFASFLMFVVLAFASSINETVLMFIFMCLVKHYLCTMASCYIPLPGGTGLMELSFILLFGVMLGDNVIGWALIAWRFFTYYLIIGHGFTHELRILIVKFAQGRKNREVSSQKKIKKRKAE